MCRTHTQSNILHTENDDKTYSYLWAQEFVFG